MIKHAYAVQMSYQVSDADKQQAEKALQNFATALKLLKAASEHLNIMYTPFKDHPDISSEQLVKFRAALRRFRDKSIENFNQFKISAFHCYTLMNVFSSDTQTLKLMKSFINSIEDIEKTVNDFSELFTDLESKTFVSDVSKVMEAIQKDSKELEAIIDERIKTHIQTNIIGKTWVDNISNDLSVKVEKKTPMMMDLLNTQQGGQNQLNKDKSK